MIWINFHKMITILLDACESVSLKHILNKLTYGKMISLCLALSCHSTAHVLI